MVKHTQTFGRLLPTNCMGVFDHFVGLAVEGLTLGLIILVEKWSLLSNYTSQRLILADCYETIRILLLYNF